MKPERWRQIEQLYDRALEMEESRRASFLREACSGDDDLRRELEQLLAEGRHAESFMEQPALREIAHEFAATAGSSWVDRQIGNYQFVSLLGAGGMGEVYRARDTKLKRDVAIKVLPVEFSRDPDRVSRFQREAQVLASLNHPNVAAIYDLEEADGLRFLILELVGGETLADRLKRGPIPLDDALQIATQIAEGLSAAHERGIVHRDLKPANIKLTPDGKVKVLDFGLAKAFEGGSADVSLSNSPTKMTASMPGTILGTAAYMSPEQAKGKEADRTSDVWAFGCVLYEMLTAKPVFTGETATEIMGRVLETEPNWNRLPAQTPEGIRNLLGRCLRKERRSRLHDIADARIEIEEVQSGSRHKEREAIVFKRSFVSRAWIVALAVVLTTLALAEFLYFRSKPAAALESTRFEIAPPGVFYTGSFAISPDGRKLAFIAARRLWIRSMESAEPRLLAGTDNAFGTPVWSPDSRSIAFFAQGKFLKIEDIGPAQTLCAIAGTVRGGFWTRDNRIVFGTAAFGSTYEDSGLWQVNAAGGAASLLTKLSPGESGHSFPTLLPDGDHFLYTTALGGAPETGGIYLGSLSAKPDQKPRKLLPGVSKAVYSPSIGGAAGADDGYLIFVRSGVLMAQSWDGRRLELKGDAVPIAEHVSSSGLSASATGVLVYETSSAAGDRITWLDRQGRVLEAVGEPFAFAVNSPPVLSPDGKRVAFSRTDAVSGDTDINLFEFSRGVNSRFTSDPGEDLNPVWSFDGSQVAFAAQRAGVWGIYQKASNDLTGNGELLYTSGNQPARPSSWSGDGRFLLFSAGSPYDIWVLPLNAGSARAGTARTPLALVKGSFNERGARFSPDGRFYTYVSDLSGMDEIYVQTFDPSASGTLPAEAVKISKDGGIGMRWSADGKEIFYRSPNGDLMYVEVSTTPVFRPGAPRLLFKAPPSSSSQLIFWDVAPDGQRFLFALPVRQNSTEVFTVVQNWWALLKH